MIDCNVEELDTLENFDVVVMRHVLSHLVGRETAIGRVIGRPGGVLGMISSIPFVALGMLLNLNDNLTIIAKRRA